MKLNNSFLNNDFIQDGEINDKKELYTFFELLGEGAFCKVYKAIYKPTQETLAVKVSNIHNLNLVI